MSTGRLVGFRRFLKEWPILGNQLLYCKYAFFGTLVVQTAEQWKIAHADASAVKNNDFSAVTRKIPYYNWRVSMPSPSESNTTLVFNYDMARVFGMMFFAVAYNGPANAIIYPFYARYFTTVNKCILFDQTFYMPCCAIPACWYFSNFIKKFIMCPPETQDGDLPKLSFDLLKTAARETTAEMKTKWVSNVQTTMMIWIPAEQINMRLTPVYLRSPVAGATSFFWISGMAIWTNVVKGEGDADDGDASVISNSDA